MLLVIHRSQQTNAVRYNDQTRNSMNDPQNRTSESVLDIEAGIRSRHGLVRSKSKWDDMDAVDMTRVQNAINETGNNSYGIIAVDVWYLDEEDGKLYHFGDSGGINWVSPIYKQQLEQDIKVKDSSTTLSTLLELCSKQPVETEISGVGLAGNFWQLYGNSAGSGGDWSQPILWRDLRELTTDPDQMPSARLISLAKVFGKCTGIPFSIQGKFKGVVLYFVRLQCDVSVMNSDVNVNFLHFSSQYIGAASAMTEARSKSVAQRKERLTKACSRFRLAFRTMQTFQSLLGNPKVLDDEGASVPINSLNPIGRKKSPFVDIIRKFIHGTNRSRLLVQSRSLSKVKSVQKKSLDPPLSPPPVASVATAAWISIGCFVTLLVLLGLNILVKDVSNGDYAIVLGPFGALLTLQFALTAAPAAQPRNSVYGIVLSAAISLLFKFLLFELAGVPQWIAAAIGVSLAIGGMSKAGIVHPPAGAVALVFAMSNNSIGKDLVLLGILLCADLAAIFMATLINNLSATRQYPMYWSFFPKCKKEE